MKINTYTGYTTTKRYRVLIQPVEVDERTVFHYFTELKDLRAVVKNYIEELSNEEDFQIFVKLNQLTEDGISNIDVKVSVTFEETKNLFYVPDPVVIPTEGGEYHIEATEEYEVCIAFSAVLSVEEYSTKILDVMDGLIDKKGITNDLMPVYVLLIVYDRELDMFEAFPLSITINFYPKNEKLEPSKRVLQFGSFVESLAEQGEEVNKKIRMKRW